MFIYKAEVASGYTDSVVTENRLTNGSTYCTGPCKWCSYSVRILNGKKEKGKKLKEKRYNPVGSAESQKRRNGEDVAYSGSTAKLKKESNDYLFTQ